MSHLLYNCGPTCIDRSPINAIKVDVKKTKPDYLCIFFISSEDPDALDELGEWKQTWQTECARCKVATWPVRMGEKIHWSLVNQNRTQQRPEFLCTLFCVKLHLPCLCFVVCLAGSLVVWCQRVKCRQLCRSDKKNYWTEITVSHKITKPSIEQAKTNKQSSPNCPWCNCNFASLVGVSFNHIYIRT